MNKDLDPHFLPDGQYRDALNIIVSDSDGRFIATEGEHNGVAQNYLGNIQKNASLGLLPDALCIGAISVPAQNTIYWFVTSSTFDAIFEYNEQFDTTAVVLKSIKAENNVLNFSPNYRITGVNYINGLLFWTDNYNPPRKINIERCKNYAEDLFTQEDISVIVKPPIASPTIVLSDDTASTSNNLENKFIYFSYRYKYLDDEYSALSPFSPVAFFPKPFAYDYGVSENVSMVNSKNTATISYYTGGANVKEIQLVFTDTLSTNAYVIDNINKEANNFEDNVIKTFEFKNNKVYTVLPADQINRLFDNVPLRAQAQDMIGSRLIYGNYTQFFDLVDCNGANINPVFTADFVGSQITDNAPHATFKSNRDYEVGIVYLDEYGRSTTVIVPTENTNTVYIPADRANYANDIKITIDKDYAPPCFATYYRFVLKQNKQEYYNVFPLTYFTDGQFKWFLINQSDIDKVSVGSYLYLKNSTNSNLNTQFKVLDVVSKNANFLNNNKTQPAGVYFKVKIESLNLPLLYSYNFSNVTTDSTLQPLTTAVKFVDNPIFYGLGNNDLQIGNSHIMNIGVRHDVRFTVKIDSVSNTGDTFSLYAFQSGAEQLVAEKQPIIAGVEQGLYFWNGSTVDVGEIVFGSSTGHKLGDYWTIMARSFLSSGLYSGQNSFSDTFIYGKYYLPNNPYAFITGNGWNLPSGFVGDRPIKAGASITIKMKEPLNGNTEYTQSFISTREYKNIEEWFFEDRVYTKWIQYDGAKNIGAANVFFYRINSFTNPILNDNQWQATSPTSINSTLFNSPIFMWVRGAGEGTAITMSGSLELEESLSPILFETVPTDTNQDIYYELTNTYPIVNNSHYANGTNQVLGSTDGVAYLKKQDSTSYPNYDFNAFAWSNGVESFRIRDDWNAAKMEFSPRANSTVEGYAEQTLVQALTYSGVYQQTTAINRLNEFNLSLGNFKYLDRFFGSIQKLHARDTDLTVFQENKISKVLYGKNLISDSVGGGTIASIPEVLGTQIAYIGEYGISDNPESFAIWGNNMYFTDARRGAVLQLTEAGLFEVSSNGMKNWFKVNLDPETLKIGMFDPYFEHYVVSINNERQVSPCILNVSTTNAVVPCGLNNNQFAFAIESNSQWYISVPDNDWLTLNTRYGVGNQQILATTTYTEETQSINVIVSGCDTDITVSITQCPTLYWYKIINCNTSEVKYSQAYSQYHLIGSRVLLGSVAYTINQSYTSNPNSDPKYAITFTSETGCPDPEPTQEWYTLINCATSVESKSIGYPINQFAINARVTSGGIIYRISAKTTTDPGGTQKTITSTGFTGCPAPSQEWYRLYNCTTGNIAFSIAYNTGTYSIGDRVTSGSNTYTVNTILTTEPIGTLLTLTATGDVGCPSTITYYTLTGSNSTIATKWYRLYNCSTGATAYSIGYPETIVFNINDRVTSGGVNYTIADIYTVSTGTNQISITATGIVGCPTTAQEWYYLTNCSNGATAYSIAYPPNTFAVDRRVTNLNNTYVVTSILPSNPGGTQLTLADAGVSGCPPVYTTTWYTLRRCSDNATFWSQGYQSPTFFSPNERVTSGASTYVILQGYSQDPGGTQLPITSTGQFYCPSIPPTQEWYIIVRCSDGFYANTIGYNVGTFSLDDRVTVGTDIYRIGSVLTTNPGGTQLSITSTGLTGCPIPAQEWYKLYICDTGQTRYSTAYNVGTFVLNERVLTDTDFIARISEVLSVEPSFNKVGISYTGFFNCP
jgi:hypothetical protein